MRGRVWRRTGAPDARLWFDFPVIAWTTAPVGKDLTAGLAASVDKSFGISGVRNDDGCWYLVYEDGFARWMSGARAMVHEYSGYTRPETVPFDEKPGVFLACAPGSAWQDAPEPFTAADTGSRTFELATVCLEWTMQPCPSSVWRTVATVRATVKKMVRSHGTGQKPDDDGTTHQTVPVPV